MDVWNNKNGMTSNNVLSVFQSDDDYLWLSSFDGLQKFDGVTFESFDKSNIPNLVSNSIFQITQDQKGILWFSTESNGIMGFNGRSFFSLPQNDSIPSAVKSIHIDSKNNFWIGTINNGLFKIDNSGKVSKELGIPDRTINEITEGREGNIWVSTGGAGVFKISEGGILNFSKSIGLSSNLIRPIHISDDNLAYVGTVSGLNIINESQIEVIEVFDNLQITDLLIDDYNNLWAATTLGIARYNLKDKTFELFAKDQGFPGGQVEALFFDNEGSLWVSTYQSGLIRFKNTTISSLTTKNGLSSNQVRIIKSHNNEYYIGTDDGNVNVYDGEKINPLKLKDNFQRDVIRDFLFKDDEIWVANYQGIAVIHDQNQKYHNETNGLPDNKVRLFFLDSEDNTWLGTRTGGLIRFNKSGKHQVYDKSNGLNSNYIMSIDQDIKGNIVIGTNAGGLSILAKDGKVRNYSILHDDSGTVIFNLQIDESNIIWLCTNIGLFRFKDDRFEKVTLGKGIKTEKFFDILDDKIGSYWLSSGEGILKIKKTALNKYFDQQEASVKFDLFNEDDGMQSKECTAATRSFFDENAGKIWVPTNEGVAIVDPDNLVFNAKIPKVYITNVQIDTTVINPLLTKHLEINPNTFRYQFEATSLSYLAPSKVRFKYKLEGVDDRWYGPTYNRKIEYTNLPYGDYTLRVIASNNDNIWNEEGTTFSFMVLPKFYETLWFKLCIITSMILVFWAFYRWRVEDIKKTNKAELSEFKSVMIHMIAHDIKNPLNSIMGIAYRIHDKSSEKIIQSSKTILQLINNMLDVEKFEHTDPKIKLEKIQITDLISESQLAIQTLLDEKSLLLNVDIDKDCELEVDIYMIQRVFINLISNAIKFSPSNSEITIRVEYPKINDQEKIKISFIDKGKGIHPDDVEHLFKKFWQKEARQAGAASSTGLGLAFCKMAVTAHKGEIKATSDHDKGSTFMVELPLNEVQVKTEKKVDQNSEASETVCLNEKDLESIQPFVDRLKSLKIHQVSAIVQILEEIETLNLDSSWPTELKSAVYYSNKEEYEKLMNMI